MYEYPRILILEDSSADAELAEREIRRSLVHCEFLQASSEPSFIEALNTFRPDLIVADYFLPQFSGLEALKLVQQKNPFAPVIILTGSVNEEIAVDSMKAGAADYVIKENIRRLGPAVERALAEKKIRIERNQAYGILQKNEERYRNTLDNMLEACQIIDFDWHYLYLNESAVVHSRLTREEMLGKRVMDVWPGIESTHLFHLMKQCMEERKPIGAEAEFMFPDGSSGFFELSLQPIQEGIFIVSADISGRKQAEKSLRLFRALIDQSPDAVEVIDPSSGRFMDANEMAWQSLGYTRDEFLSLVLGDIVSGEVLDPAIQEEIRERDNLVIEAIHRRKDGTAFPVELHIRSVQLDRPYQVIIARDITQRKVTEAALQQSNEELARLYRASGSLLSAGSASLAEQADQIVAIIQQEFGQSNCSLSLVDREANEIRQIAILGPFTSPVKGKVLMADGPGLIAKAVHSGKTINVPDVQKEQDYLPCWEAARSELVIPLQAGGEVIGAIDLQSSTVGAFTPNDERIMSIFSERAALVLERSRLHVQTQTHLDQLISLRTIDIAISSSFDINFTLGIVLQQVVEKLNIHAADVLVYSAHSQIIQLCAEQGFHLPRQQRSFIHFHDDLVGRVIHERRMVEVPDLDKRASQYSLMADIAREGFQAYIGIPLIAKGQVKGVLGLYQRGQFNLTSDQRGFLEILAGQAAIAIDNSQLFENMQMHNADLTTAYDETIQGWSQAMDLRDKETEGHSRRVTEWTVELAGRLGLKQEDLIHIRRGALLHDIGKIGVPDEILRKPASLNEDEWVIMRKHPQFAFDMLYPITYLHPALDIPYSHHEKWDGSGYPRSLRETKIPLAARIFAVVDVWDALTSDRPYRKAWPKTEAISYIREQAGKHFDPGITRQFLEMIHNN